MLALVDWFSDYIRNIAVVVLFITFVGMIVPSGKYAGYLKLVSGFVLMFVMLSPLVGLLGLGRGVGLVASVPAFSEIAHGHGQAQNPQQLAHQAMVSQLVTLVEQHVRQLVSEHGLQPVSVGVNAHLADTDTLVVSGLHVQLKVPAEEEPQQQDNAAGLGIAPVVIERVVITGRTQQVAELSDERVTQLQTALSQFYNLAMAHIHISIQSKG